MRRGRASRWFIRLVFHLSTPPQLHALAIGITERETRIQNPPLSAPANLFAALGQRQTNMDNKCSHPPKVVVNLKQLPPIDPFRIMNSSSKDKKLNNYSTRAASKVVKPSPNQDMELVDSDQAILQNPTLGNVVVDNASSISSNKKSETCRNTTSLNQTASPHKGTKKGSARSNLYEICAANHWKPPIFECCKEEGPSHRRMFTFKVIIEIEEASRNIIECYGAPHQKKKIAADHAAEGALWYLKYVGYVMKNQ